MKRVCLFLALCIAGIMQAQTTSSVVVKKGNMFYCGEQQMDRAAYKQFLETECPQAYQQYHQGEQCMIAGWSLFGGGAVGAFAGFATFISQSNFGGLPPEQYHGNTALGLTGFCFSVLSGAGFLCSIPLLSFGYVRMDNSSVKTYNEQCAKQDIELAFGMTSNGVGMTIRF